MDNTSKLFSSLIHHPPLRRYELTAALLGLESGRGVDDEEDQINEEISASIEDTVDFSDYGLTDVYFFIPNLLNN